ncbi:two-component sensor histidine kinase [Bacillus pseudomycoides]|uniref:ATP-binding protein n=1 Tax=Bacillus pseudomycoides TaxID=64104 RepID=UPI000BF5614C|nr:ATP-binding protein [Bacillus pseudomycoides]PGE97150.1 two-component sensor histidine kinase [Bacillus pseudomycoides]PHE34954.1 two-component sensor histidine kinase [Bacillus pseudomycoides]
MKESFISFQEEKKNARLFLWVLNIVWVIYETVYYVMLGDSETLIRLDVQVPTFLYGACLIACSMYMMKREQAYRVKYIYLIAYMCSEILNLYWYALHNKVAFDDGHTIEFVFILFVPIFMSKRYLLWLFLVIMGKYSVLLVLGKKAAFMPLVMYSLLLFVTYLLLNRFLQYLSTVNNVMIEKRESEKLVVIGKMAASVGHEIKNPLSSLRGFTQLQKEKYVDDKVYEHMIDEIEHINNMISELMVMATCKPSTYSSYLIEGIVSNALKEMSAEINKKQLYLIYDVAPDQIKIDCDHRKLKGVFLYIIKNAIEAMEHGGTLQIHINKRNEDGVIVSIVDNGCGVQEENLQRITEAFYTTKKNGIGLGLTVACKIIEEHDGKIHITSKRNVGTKVDIILPI